MESKEGLFSMEPGTLSHGSALERINALTAAHSASRRIARAIERWRFRLFQSHRHRSLVIERVDDISLVILPDVFNPRLFHSGAMLARAVSQAGVLTGVRVLDLGCGSGVAGIAAARLGATVIATDINLAAARCTRINVLLNNLDDHIEVREGDLFAPVEDERFDLILFNPPYFHGQPQAQWELAWRSEDVLQRFASELPSMLSPGGRAMLALSTVCEDADEVLTAAGLRIRTSQERQMPAERLFILEVRAGS